MLCRQHNHRDQCRKRSAVNVLPYHCGKTKMPPASDVSSETTYVTCLRLRVHGGRQDFPVVSVRC